MAHGRVVAHTDLRVWKQSMDLAEDVYRLTWPMPKEEQYGLANQIRRAVSSIPANIAEGAGRNSNRDFVRFLSIARGSLCELETHLMLCERLGLIRVNADVWGRIKLLRTMLTKLMRAVQRRAGLTLPPSLRDPVS